jgi:hypothetical protein
VGDRRKRALRVQFDGKLRLEFHGAKITSDAGLLPFRELDEAFRLTEAASVMFSDFRRGKNTQHTLLAMLRQAVYGRLAGYEDVNEAERLRVDPGMRRVVGGRAHTKQAASTNEMSGQNNHVRFGKWGMSGGVLRARRTNTYRIARAAVISDIMVEGVTHTRTAGENG